MTLDQARAILDAHLAGSRTLRYADWAVAGQVIGDHYSDHPELLGPVRLTHDAASRPRTRDETTSGGSEPGGAVGSVLVQKLPGPVSSYYIDLDPISGSAALYRTVDSDGAGEDMGAPNAGTFDHASQVRLEMRRIDAARGEAQRATLVAINKRNSEIWGGAT